MLAAGAVAGQPTLSLPEFAVALLRRRSAQRSSFSSATSRSRRRTAPRLAPASAAGDGYWPRASMPASVTSGQTFPGFRRRCQRPPVPSRRWRRPSRLVFKFGASSRLVPYDLPGLLVSFDLNIIACAFSEIRHPSPANGPAPTSAAADRGQRSRLRPWSLFLSPNATAGWANRNRRLITPRRADRTLAYAAQSQRSPMERPSSTSSPRQRAPCAPSGLPTSNPGRCAGRLLTLLDVAEHDGYR